MWVICCLSSKHRKYKQTSFTQNNHGSTNTCCCRSESKTRYCSVKYLATDRNARQSCTIGKSNHQHVSSFHFVFGTSRKTIYVYFYFLWFYLSSSFISTVGYSWYSSRDHFWLSTEGKMNTLHWISPHKMRKNPMQCIHLALREVKDITWRISWIDHVFNHVLFSDLQRDYKMYTLHWILRNMFPLQGEILKCLEVWDLKRS